MKTMKTIYFTSKNIGKTVNIESRPEDEIGYDWETENYQIIGDEQLSDTGLVNIDTLISTLESFKEKGANFVSCDWHCDHGELDVSGYNFTHSSDSEINIAKDAMLAKKELLKQRQIKELEDKLAKLKA